MYESYILLVLHRYCHGIPDKIWKMIAASDITILYSKVEICTFTTSVARALLRSTRRLAPLGSRTRAQSAGT